jgi:hypothetical protein
VANYYLFNNTCHTSCPLGYYILNYTCLSSCPIGSYILNITCVSSCPIGNYIINITCVSSCPIGYYIFNQTCVSSCPLGYYLFNNTCLSSCPLGYYAPLGYLCCRNECRTCSNADNCTACKTGFTVEGKCFTIKGCNNEAYNNLTFRYECLNCSADLHF